MNILDKAFFENDVDTVAQNLIGKKITHKNKEGIIYEVESYCEDDPASHSYKGKITNRNKVMFEEAGTVYVYLTYGLHYCINIVTSGKNIGSAVLIRGIFNDNEKLIVSGPGKVSRFLEIDRESNNSSVINNKALFISETGLKFKFEKTKRIGINKAVDKLRRYVVKEEVIKNYFIQQDKS